MNNSEDLSKNGNGQDQEEAEDHLEQAEKYWKKHKLTDAMVECELAIKLSPDWSDAHNLHGLVLEEKGDVDEALQSYEKAVILDPENEEAKTNLDDLKAEIQEEREKKLRSKNKSKEIKPNNPANATQIPPKNFRITTHLLSIFIPGVLLTFIILPALGGNQSLPGLLGGILVGILADGLLTFLYYALAAGLEWKNESLSFIRLAIFWIFSGFIFGLCLLGLWYLIRYVMAKIYRIPFGVAKGRLLNTHLDAEKYTSGGYNLVTNKPVLPSAKYQLRQAGRLYEKDKNSEALTQCDQAIALTPDFTEVYNLRGLILEELKRLDDAMLSYEKALLLEPDCKDAINNKAEVETTIAEKLEEASKGEYKCGVFETSKKIQDAHCFVYQNQGANLKIRNRGMDFGTLLFYRGKVAAAASNAVVVPIIPIKMVTDAIATEAIDLLILWEDISKIERITNEMNSSFYQLSFNNRSKNRQEWLWMAIYMDGVQQILVKFAETMGKHGLQVEGKTNG